MQKWSAHAILLGKKLDLLPKRCSFMATWPWRLVGLVLVAMSAPVMSASVLNCGPVRVHQCLVTTIRSYWPLCCHVERSWMLYNLIAHNYSMLAPRFRKSSGIHNIYIYMYAKKNCKIMPDVMLAFSRLQLGNMQNYQPPGSIRTSR